MSIQDDWKDAYIRGFGVHDGVFTKKMLDQATTSTVVPEPIPDGHRLGEDGLVHSYSNGKALCIKADTFGWDMDQFYTHAIRIGRSIRNIPNQAKVQYNKPDKSTPTNHHINCPVCVISGRKMMEELINPTTKPKPDTSGLLQGMIDQFDSFRMINDDLIDSSVGITNINLGRYDQTAIQVMEQQRNAQAELQKQAQGNLMDRMIKKIWS